MTNRSVKPVERNPIRRFLKLLGPGLITGCADDDPSGIGTYATAGASLGYSLLWTALLTLPAMAAVQFICARIGLISGMGINPIKALFWTAVINGFLAPPLLVVIMRIGNDRRAMGDAVNSRGLNLLGWATAAVMFAAAAALIWVWTTGAA